MSHTTGGIVMRKMPKQRKAPGQSPAGLPEKATKPKAAKPHPVAAALFHGLTPGFGKKVGNPFALTGRAGQPLPFHTATGIGGWQQPAFGATPGFGRKGGFGGKGY